MEIKLKFFQFNANIAEIVDRFFLCSKMEPVLVQEKASPFHLYLLVGKSRLFLRRRETVT